MPATPDLNASVHPLKRLWDDAARHRPQILLATFCSVINKVFDLAPPVLIGAAVDIVVRREDSVLTLLGVSDPRHQIISLAGLTFLIWCIESAFEYAYAILWRGLAQTIQHELRIDAYSHVQRLDMAYFDERHSSGLMAILNDDVNQLERFLDGGANDLLQVVTTVLVIGGIFFALAPSVAWMSFLPIPIILWGSLRFQSRIAPRYARVRERVAALNQQLSNNLGGITTIRSFAREDQEVARVARESDIYRAANQHAIRLSSAFTPLIRIAVLTGFSATLVFGGFLALDGALEVGAYSVMVFLTQRLLWPLTRLGQTIDLYHRAMASTRRIFELLDTSYRLSSGPRSLTEPLRGEIELDDVTFAYQEGYPILQNLSLRIQAGQTIGIVGATGSGKSTLIKLLLRLYDPDSGTISVDGIPLPELNLRDLRSSLGLVSQDVFLFHGTVHENIAYGDLRATEEALQHAAQVAEADEFVQRLPESYDTIVGERGQRLSGGQRQRISIARAVLKDPPILILDEATSAVDNETEAAIQRSLERIAEGRTTLVIAHRLSTIRNADHIFVLDGGRLAENGTHEELLTEGGIYAGLWNVQTGSSTNL